MKVLVVGGGGREHALIRKIKESPRVTEIACCPGNGGISYDAQCYPVSATDIDGVVNLAKEIKADFVVVAPDDPLVAGMVDALNEAGFPTFGPKANAAIIEGSKVFSKNLMLKYNIPTAEYKVFDNPEDVITTMLLSKNFLQAPRFLFLRLLTESALNPWFHQWTIKERLTAIKVSIQAVWVLFHLILTILPKSLRSVWIKYSFPLLRQ